MDAFLFREVLMDTNENAGINVEKIEADFNTFLYQVQSERAETRELQRRLDEETRKRYDTECKLMQAENENAELKNQYKSLIAAMNRQEPAKIEVLAKESIKFEALTKERDRLLELLQAANIKYFELKRNNDEAVEKLKVLNGKVTNSADERDKILMGLTNLKKYFLKLESDEKDIIQMVASANEVTKRANNAINYYVEQYEKVLGEKKQLHHKLHEAQATIFILEDTKSSIVVRDNKSLLKEIQSKLGEMAGELHQEKVENAKLRTNLANSIMMQECLAKQMEIMNSREDHNAFATEESQITSSNFDLTNDQNVNDNTDSSSRNQY